MIHRCGVMCVCLCVLCVCLPCNAPHVYLPHTKVVMRKADRAETDTFISLTAVDVLPFKQL